MTPTSALDLYNGESSFAKTKTNSDVAKPRAGGASYDWGRSSNTDWEGHVMICKNEDNLRANVCKSMKISIISNKNNKSFKMKSLLY